MLANCQFSPSTRDNDLAYGDAVTVFWMLAFLNAHSNPKKCAKLREQVCLVSVLSQYLGFRGTLSPPEPRLHACGGAHRLKVKGAAGLELNLKAEL